MSITLTLAEIIDIVEFAGLAVAAAPPDDELEVQFTVTDCPAEGVWNEGEPADPNSRSYFRHIVYCTDYPEEGCAGIGPEIAAAPADAGEVGK